MFFAIISFTLLFNVWETKKSILYINIYIYIYIYLYIHIALFIFVIILNIFKYKVFIRWISKGITTSTSITSIQTNLKWIVIHPLIRFIRIQSRSVSWGSMFRDTNFIANDQLKLDNVIQSCLITINIILYYSFSLDIH